MAEAHQVLCKNGLREMVRLETDGKLMSGYDVAVALLLGAEEFAFATAALIAMGCRMMRVCNLDTCPFGIATQNPELRKHFKGKPEYVARLMLFIAQQLRRIMARLGARTVDELVGRSDLLSVKSDSPLTMEELIGRAYPQHSEAEQAFDFALEDRADAKPCRGTFHLRNTDRAFGATLPATDKPLSILCDGCGGQSFGAFLTKGYTVTLGGVANDYVGKGLSGGMLVVRPPAGERWSAQDVLIGNVALFGATSGSAYIAGRAGERFCVRNSGACAVVEGVGDHGCEYMTGGRAAILGSVGHNFAAGMSGGIAYVWDESGVLDKHINPASVDILSVQGAYADELRAMLQAHAAATGSPTARRLLSAWDVRLPEFKMVMPKEYRRLLEER